MIYREDINLLVIFKITKKKEMEKLFMIMVMNFKDSGLMIKEKKKVY
jgi:hypothetical protein